jgi:serine/threonine-protein phosphatase 5
LLQDFPVDPSYNGPTLAEGPVDHAFVKDMMDYFVKSHDDRSLPPFPPKYVIQLLQASIEQHSRMSALVRIPLSRAGQTVTVFGDTHGQFYDFRNILTDAVAGYPSRDNVLVFNGDFVDRGRYGMEIVLSLLAMRLADPEALYMNRGNHETVDMNEQYNFYTDIKSTYKRWEKTKTINSIIQLFKRTFIALPVATLVNEKVFVVHGGIGPKTSEMTLKKIDSVGRFKEPRNIRNKKTGRKEPDAITELLWSGTMTKIYIIRLMPPLVGHRLLIAGHGNLVYPLMFSD